MLKFAPFWQTFSDYKKYEALNLPVATPEHAPDITQIAHPVLDDDH
jgi:hypothetical protein